MAFECEAWIIGSWLNRHLPIIKVDKARCPLSPMQFEALCAPGMHVEQKEMLAAQPFPRKSVAKFA